jgi:excisionase family DNA binding protein
VSRREAAGYLGISEWSIKTLHWHGHLPAVRLPGVRRQLFDLQDLEALIAAAKRA